MFGGLVLGYNIDKIIGQQALGGLLVDFLDFALIDELVLDPETVKFGI
jgi:hypothetical protein